MDDLDTKTSWKKLQRAVSDLQIAIDVKDKELVKHSVRLICNHTIGDVKMFKLNGVRVRFSNLNGLTMVADKDGKSVNYLSGHDYRVCDGKKTTTLPGYIPMEGVFDQVFMGKMELLFKTMEEEDDKS